MNFLEFSGKPLQGRTGNLAAYLVGLTLLTAAVGIVPHAGGLGENTILGNLAGVVSGMFMYFPTLVEVPIAKMFLNLGVHRGPLLAYLMADPELSLQSILMISVIIGRLKAWTYVEWVAFCKVLENEKVVVSGRVSGIAQVTRLPMIK